jgi:hypothetical protein
MASVIDTFRHADGWQNSISAYFYTSSHSVFIASLCAVGICLIVYQGSTTTEDALLNFSGVLAIVVGLVPTGREELRGPGLPEDFDATAFVENNVRALLIACVVAVAVYVLIQVVRKRLATPPQAELSCQTTNSPPEDAKPLPPLLATVVQVLGKVLSALAPLVGWLEKVLPCALLAALAAGAAVFFVDLPMFVRNAHGVAAYTMFGGIIVVAVHYACYAALRKRTRTAYTTSLRHRLPVHRRADGADGDHRGHLAMHGQRYRRAADGDHRDHRIRSLLAAAIDRPVGAGEVSGALAQRHTDDAR